MKTVLLAALVGTISGCMQTPARDMPVDRVSSSPGPITHAIKALEMRGLNIIGSWTLVSVNNKPVAPRQLQIAFQPQFFEANVNCNKMSGFWALKQSSFVPDRAVATEKGCGPALPFDGMITRALQTGMALSLTTNGNLVGETGSHRLTFVRTPM